VLVLLSATHTATVWIEGYAPGVAQTCIYVVGRLRAVPDQRAHGVESFGIAGSLPLQAVPASTSSAVASALCSMGCSFISAMMVLA
jgi:hypothetical protein